MKIDILDYDGGAESFVVKNRYQILALLRCLEHAIDHADKFTIDALQGVSIRIGLPKCAIKETFFESKISDVIQSG